MHLFVCGFVVLIVISNIQALTTNQKQNESIKTSFSPRGILESCDSDNFDDTSITCYGMKIFEKLVQGAVDLIIDLQNLFTTDGHYLTDNKNHNEFKESKILNNTSLMALLKNKHYKIKINNTTVSHQEKSRNNTAATGRGKSAMHGKHGSNLLLTALLLGLGLLAMKALVASSLALMLSLLMTIKKHHGHEGYSDHRRRRYSVDSETAPYRGWTDSYKRRK